LCMHRFFHRVLLVQFLRHALSGPLLRIQPGTRRSFLFGSDELPAIHF
jgi:hypothetical protein